MVNIELVNAFQIHAKKVSANFSLEKGLNVLTGPNGIGKSTFFNYLKHHRKELLLNRSCAFMDQFPLQPLSELRGKDIIQIMAEDFSHFDVHKAYHFVSQFSFEHLLYNKVQSYSGGENQIFKFILLLSQQADFYFLDEPLQYLDDKNIELFLDVLKEFNDKYVFIIEHRKEKIQQLSARFIIMKQDQQSIKIEA